MYLTSARPNCVQAEVSANLLTTNFTLNVFFLNPCVLCYVNNTYLSTDHTARL